MAFSKHLEEIIEAALADGMITEKERAVLHKKAQQEGIDPDEVDVVIDGRLQQKYNEVEAAKQKVRKCPSCGEIIPAMSAVCPNCGQIIDISKTEDKALQELITKLDDALVKISNDPGAEKDEKKVASLNRLIKQAKRLYGNNKQVNQILQEIEDTRNEVLAKHQRVIRMRYIAFAIWFPLVVVLVPLIMSILTPEETLSTRVGMGFFIAIGTWFVPLILGEAAAKNFK